ncbi:MULTISPECIES: prolyl oligopeptidase family serine peptidase [unclassified Lysobacter]|uniref:S9 family peptidase n=1 Tax=unclassified Lysobacter TaxID=2635362 RepID=UPI001BEAD6FA|nr:MULTISPECIES: prolyl oligopeptidase family serine peptidase [unclassified Lysobacter]MBT2745218.1 S9 family peptidase [Lysobacter sp. ISL-42]MBT2753585.1 S9 family peptidase [Lysobacter sp. ISL-50]MBT2779843.1 S9 family peptidase [Lysobacter sp. ISL-54]MBT2784486.1 S9 family peptidase [Lysobacter sp. ISL-52]
MSLRHVLTVTALALACAGTAHARAAAQAGGEVARQEQGNRVSENVPTIPAELQERLNRYQNTRGASFGGWTHDGCLLIGTRFAETAQAHRVCQPLGMREQLTFYPEPVNNLTVAPAPSDGFVFGKDVGGNEFWQLHYFDLATRQVSLLTDGKARNQNPLFSHDGKQFAYSSTARNGRDIDVWVMDFATRKARAVVTDGGTWSAQDFSPDGKQLLVIKFVSAGESYPGLVDLDSGKLTLFPVDGGKASISDFRFSRDGRAVYFVSDEPVDGKPQEFRTLRRHEPASGKFDVLSANIPWDVDQLALAEDGKHLLFVSNEDGVGKLHVLSLPQHKQIKLPALPIGVIGRADFSPDGKRIALAINTSTSPSDLYVIDLASAQLARWTRSEVGGLDSTRFVTPSLIRYPTFDTVDGGARRTIPAFYYKPAQVPAGKKLPVVINIHGGPEGQSQPSFNATAQFLANELGVAMLVPNVRGSSGYGRTYLSLDNAEKREDSVKDIGALLDWVGQQPELDAQRVGVYGGSYGGYMVLASLTHYSDRIRAGVDVVGISDFTTFLNNTESYRRDLRRAEYGDERIPRMKAVFDRISPLKNAGKIASPLFVAQGRNDPRVPYTEAEQIVKAVRANGQPVWFLMFNDEGHGFQKKANTDYFGAAMMAFWQRHLMGGE